MRNSPDALMLFAAGLGKRMAPLTDTVPKPLIEIAGRPLIDHALALTDGQGLRRVVANMHYRAEMIADHLAGSGVTAIDEQPDVLDTGGGLKHALPVLGDGPVFTLNTDAVWFGGAPLQTLRDSWDGERMDALLLLVRREAAVGHLGKGDFLVEREGRLTPGRGLVYTGLQIVNGDLALEVPERIFSMWRIWNAALDRGRMFGVEHTGRWCDVGRPDCIELAETMLASSCDV